jgi:dihydroorotate dehydrogenase
MIYSLFKSIAFKLDPEDMHEFAMRTLGKYPKLFSQVLGQNDSLDPYHLKAGGVVWPFPVGLAAGLDKNAEAIDFFSRLYFGGIEVGTVTPKPQPGNPKPRMFRLIKERSLRNQMGFNNKGAEVVYKNILASSRGSRPLGINLGKNKLTPDDKAWEDYLMLYKKFCEVGDYLVINVSSPNTKGLRDLQKSDFLRELFSRLEDQRKQKPVPLFLKVSPDLDFTHVDSLLALALEFKLNGIIATNTTIRNEYGPGGISGELLKEKSKAMRKYILERVANNKGFEVIGVGGISNFSDIWEFWKLGGKIVQIYTSFIYQGPFILEKIKREIDKKLKENQASGLRELLDNIDQAR